MSKPTDHLSEQLRNRLNSPTQSIEEVFARLEELRLTGKVALVHASIILVHDDDSFDLVSTSHADADMLVELGEEGAHMMVRTLRDSNLRYVMALQSMLSEGVDEDDDVEGDEDL